MILADISQSWTLKATSIGSDFQHSIKRSSSKLIGSRENSLDVFVWSLRKGLCLCLALRPPLSDSEMSWHSRFSMHHSVRCPCLLATEDTDVAYKDILEFSGIAWPNPGMWKQAAFRPTINRQLPNKDEEAHGHSPRRTTNRGEQAEHQEPLNSSRSAFSIMNSRAMLPPLSTSAPANWPHTRPEPGMLSPQSLNLPDDPFLEYYASNALGKRSNQRSSIEDVAMPDYASTQSGGESKRAFSDLTRMSYEQMANPVGLLGSNLDVDVDELLRGLSPEKKHELRQKLGLDTPAEAGPQPPANTPVAGAPSSNRPSAAAQARWASAGRAAVRFTSLPSQTVRTDHQAYRQPTPRFSALDGACSEASVAKPSPTPSDTVQSKKVLTPPEANRETTSSSHEPSLPPQSGSSLSTRVTASLRADHPVPDDLKTKASPEAKKRAANDLGSPSRKVSKRISSQGGQNNEGSSLGSPWDDIVNVDD